MQVLIITQLKRFQLIQETNSQPTKSRIMFLTTLAMIAFAGNSLLCRAALKQTEIDAASFTSIRLLSGVIMLWLLVSLRKRKSVNEGQGNWLSAIALFVYAAGFSYAYISLETGAGALLLFGAVQATMIGYGFYKGERLNKLQSFGLLLAFVGIAGLLLPGLSAPPLVASLIMLSAGVAWGFYSIRGKGAGDPTLISAGNFLRTIPFVIVLSLLTLNNNSLDMAGLWYAVASGALASGLGYALWYSVLPTLKSTSAATIQLSVPVIAAIGGIVFLSEPLTLRFALASIALLGGITLVIVEKKVS